MTEARFPRDNDRSAGRNSAKTNVSSLFRKTIAIFDDAHTLKEDAHRRFPHLID